MVGAEKAIVNSVDDANSKVIELYKKGYCKIEICLEGNPRHKKEGLLPSQMLIVAFNYRPRPDVHARNVLLNSKVSVPTVQPQPEPSPKHTYYLCSCGTEFDAHEKWVSHIRGTSHYLKDEITR
jgi:hypothetical protein